MVTAIRQHADERRASRKQAAQHAREIDEARQIELALLPRSLPVLEGWSMAARTIPAETIGGDTFDVIRSAAA